MSYVSIVQDLPQELQMPMLKLIDAVEKDLRDKLAVRRQDFDELKAIVQELSASHQRAEQRLDRVEAAIERLTEAQQRTEQRVEELAVAQQRTEQRVEELAVAQQRTEQRVEELAVAQQRTEQRLDRVEAAIERLAEAQQRAEQRLDRVEAAIERLTEAQQRAEQRLDRVEAAIERLTEAQQRTEQRVEELAEAQRRTETEIRRLADKQNEMIIQMDKLIGDQLERKYRERAFAYFGRILQKVRAVAWQEIETELEKRLSLDELEDLLLLDVLVRGRPRHQPDAPELWLAMEVSAVVDRNDVKRAQQRAALLRKAGFRAIPTVAGEQVTLGGENAARDERVFLLQDGRQQFWDEALADALSH